MNNFIQKILKEGIEEKLLPKEFIEALSTWKLWYDGYPKTAVKTILKYVPLLGSEIKLPPAFIYRAVRWKINGDGFGQSLRSWSGTLSYAKEFGTNGSIESFNKNEPIVILKLQPEQERVVLNFVELAKNKLFKSSFKYWEAKGDLMIDASFDVQSVNYEKEVIYNQPQITEKDIYLAYDNKFGWVKWNRYKYLQNSGDAVNESVLNEAKQVGVLYHYTSLHGIEGILKQNKIRSTMQTNQLFGVSTTRDKNFIKSANRFNTGIAGTSIKITLDGDKISEHYKIRPYNYRNGLSARHDSTESEEFIMTKLGLLNARSYIMKIDIFPGEERAFANSEAYSAFAKAEKIQEIKNIIQTINENNISYYIDKMWLKYFEKFENKYISNAV